jgi:hypothetical protein
MMARGRDNDPDATRRKMRAGVDLPPRREGRSAWSENKPNTATATPVRNQARKVRSLAAWLV